MQNPPEKARKLINEILKGYDVIYTQSREEASVYQLCTSRAKIKRQPLKLQVVALILVEMNGIEPSTYALRTHRSPS